MSTAGAPPAVSRGAWVAGATLAAIAAIGIALAVVVGRPPAAIEAVPAAPASPLPPLDGYIGRSFFEDPWIAAPASTTLRDGLGPLYNAHACASCHRAPISASPAGAAAPPTAMVLHVGRRAGDRFAPDPVYGGRIQRRAVRGLASGAMGEARWSLHFVEEEVDDGSGEARRLRRPVPRFEAFAYGDPGRGLLASLRMAPALAGIGRIERIADATLLSLEDPDDRDGDGISGRAHRLPARDGERPRIGRYGHKATQPSLAHQVAAALRDDIGITSRLFPDESCTPVQADCADAPGGAGPDGPFEIADAIFDALVAHVGSLAPSGAGRANAGGGEARGDKARGDDARGDDAREDGGKGAGLFGSAGCAACHRPALPGRDGEDVVLHSDLLLHDMGEGLADALGEGDALGAEWRTAPLVGVAARERGGLLHDGRARGLVEAILWHGGEAKAARERFRAMGEGERAALLDYLRAL